MIYLKWLKQRFVFLRRNLIELYNAIIYQKESRFLLHRVNAHRCSQEAILFTLFGVVWGLPPKR